MGIVRMGPPEKLVLKLQQCLNLQMFIETGTYQGWTASWASQFFPKVVTIELSELFYQQAKTTYSALENIEFLYGDTRDRLREIVPLLDAPALFWLDAHWSGGETYGEVDQCPLIEELNIINQSSVDHVILIDDARLFLSPPPPPHTIEQWPDITALLAILNHNKQRYIAIAEDVIIAVPSHVKPLIVTHFQQQAIEESHAVQSQQGDAATEDEQLMQSSGELQLLQDLAIAHGTVFDVGAHAGAWTKSALNYWSSIQVHAFEPVPQTYHLLLKKLADAIKAGLIFANPFAVANEERIQPFYYYEDAAAWSTAHRRLQVEQEYEMAPAKQFSVFSITLDDYCDRLHIPRIAFLKVDVEGGEMNVLLGAKKLLENKRIDYIQLEYGGAWKDAGTSLQQAFDYLTSLQYNLFKIMPDGLQDIPQWRPEYENYEYSNFLAMHPRFRPFLFGEMPPELDLAQLCLQNAIAPKSILSIGATTKETIQIYQAMEADGVLFVEANPQRFEQLQLRLANVDAMIAVQAAVCDVSGTTIDQLLADFLLSPQEFNILVLDVDGAELLALRGAENALRYIDAIYTKIYYCQPNESGAVVDEIDDFLQRHQFHKKAIATPTEPDWGFAFYVKRV